MRLRLLFLVLFMAGGSCCLSQNTIIDSLQKELQAANNDSIKLKTLLQISRSYMNTDPKSVIPYAEQARDLADKLSLKKDLALAYKYIGLAYYQQSIFIDAMENYNRSLDVFTSLNDKIGISNLLSNIGVVYKDQGNDTKALEYFFNSLRNAEPTGDNLRITTALNNIGSVYQHKNGTYDRALEYYLKALPRSQQLGDLELYGAITGNIGEIYLQRKIEDSALHYFKKQQQAYEGTPDMAYALNNIGKVYSLKKDYNTALTYHQKALDSSIAANSLLYQTQSLQGIAEVYEETGKYKNALQAYLKAEKLATEINSSYDLKDIYKGLSLTYANLSDYKSANKYQALLLNIKDTIYNIDIDQKLSRYEFNFEIEKKQNQINLLEKDKVLKESELRREELAKNAFLAGFGLILIIAFIIYRNYRQKVKVNLVLDSQKAQIEGLLLNILPGEVARELQQTGHATPRYYENVSVLFTDFKGFTVIADSLSPQEVVAELNIFFMAFDEIIEKYNLEKIKTIGDAYMCAGGIPLESEDHYLHMIDAALEIQEFMRLKNIARVEAGLPQWELRIGIHVGPVVAGVVGKNKYAYDIWGSSVNIASRMESNGIPGQINISAATYELVKDHYNCLYRGKISAKNIGEIDMFFVYSKINSEASNHTLPSSVSHHLHAPAKENVQY